MGVNFLIVFSCCYRMLSRNSTQDVLAKLLKTVNRWGGLALCFRLIGTLGWILSLHSIIFIGLSSIILKIYSPNLACLFFLIIGLIHSMAKRSHYCNWRAPSITMSTFPSQKCFWFLFPSLSLTTPCLIFVRMNFSDHFLNTTVVGHGIGGVSSMLYQTWSQHRTNLRYGLFGSQSNLPS